MVGIFTVIEKDCVRWFIVVSLCQTTSFIPS
jgi:hypothetical protein